MYGSRVAGVHQGRFSPSFSVNRLQGPVHAVRKSKRKQKRSKKKRQTSKEIFAFAFTWCEWTLIREWYEEGLSTKTKVLCKTNHYSFVRVPVTITLGPAYNEQLNQQIRNKWCSL